MVHGAHLLLLAVSRHTEAWVRLLASDVTENWLSKIEPYLFSGSWSVFESNFGLTVAQHVVTGLGVTSGLAK